MESEALTNSIEAKAPWPEPEAWHQPGGPLIHAPHGGTQPAPAPIGSEALQPSAAPVDGAAPPGSEASTTLHLALENQIVEAIRTCYDPEIPVNIYDLGLIYEVSISPTNYVTVRMTLTAPSCPAAESLPPEVEEKVRSVPGVRDGKVEVVWEPPWTPDRMSEEAKLELGWF